MDSSIVDRANMEITEGDQGQHTCDSKQAQDTEMFRFQHSPIINYVVYVGAVLSHFLAVFIVCNTTDLI